MTWLKICAGFRIYRGTRLGANESVRDVTLVRQSHGVITESHLGRFVGGTWKGVWYMGWTEGICLFGSKIGSYEGKWIG